MRILPLLLISLGLISLIAAQSDVCTFRTQTQGGWGTGCSGDNPGCYRDDNFDCFPDGVLIGRSDCNSALFNTSLAVENFLPSGGGPAVINGTLVNPTDPLGSLAGNLLAATLTLGFDACDSNFSTCITPIAGLCFLQGLCQGFTVRQVVDAANFAIGDCPSKCTVEGQLPLDLCNKSLSDLNTCIDTFNNAFVDGQNDTSSLDIGYCPSTEECTFRTQTQGGWGTGCSGNNPGCYRDDNFDCFPDGVLIGRSDCNNALFNTSLAVDNFLPSGGPPAVINGTLVNPTQPLGSLAGNLLAATLTLGFDACDSNFSTCITPIADLCFLTGDCQGFTVRQVVDAANFAIGDCRSKCTSEGLLPSTLCLLSLPRLNTCIDTFNNAFVDGQNASSSTIFGTSCPTITISSQQNDAGTAGYWSGLILLSILAAWVF